MLYDIEDTRLLRRVATRASLPLVRVCWATGVLLVLRLFFGGRKVSLLWTFVVCFFGRGFVLKEGDLLA